MRSVPRRLRVPGASPVMAAFWTRSVYAPWRRSIFQTEVPSRLRLGDAVPGSQRVLAQAVAEAFPPAREGWLPSQFSLRLCIRAAAALGHHRQALIANYKSTQPGRNAIRRL